MPRKPRSLAWVCLTLALLSTPHLVEAQDMPVPVDVQFSLLSRILMFEASFAEVGPADTLRMGIVYQPLFRQSNNATDALIRLIDSPEFQRDFAFPIEYFLIDVEQRLDWALSADLDLLYVTPLRAFPLTRVASVSREADILTFTGVPEYVRGGIAIGLDVAGGRARILVNLQSVKEEGASLSSQLLRLAQIVTDG